MKKKVAMLLPNYHGGGMPKIAETISLNLDQELYEQTLIILSTEDVTYDFSGKVIKISESGRNLFSKLFINTKRIDQLRKIKENENFHTVISFGVQANTLNVMTKGKEINICTEHNIKSIENRTWGMRGKIYNYFIKKYYSKADHLVAISHVMKRDLETNYGIKNDIEVIYNPHIISDIISKANGTVDPEHERLFLEGPVLITAGRLTYAKAQWSSIRAMKKLTETYPTAKLLIAGEGELQEELQKLVRELGLEDNIIFLGRLANPYPYIKKADVFVLSSLFEGFPNVLIESLACGTAIVSTDCLSGPREILDKDQELDKSITHYEVSDYGVLTPRLPAKIPVFGSELNDQEIELTKAIDYLLKNEEARKEFGKRGVHYSYNFDAKVKIKDYLKIIERDEKAESGDA